MTQETNFHPWKKVREWRGNRPMREKGTLGSEICDSYFWNVLSLQYKNHQYEMVSMRKTISTVWKLSPMQYIIYTYCYCMHYVILYCIYYIICINILYILFSIPCFNTHHGILRYIWWGGSLFMPWVGNHMLFTLFPWLIQFNIPVRHLFSTDVYWDNKGTTDLLEGNQWREREELKF